NGKWNIERENTSDGLKIKYKFFHGQGTADNKSGKNIKSCKRVITVLEYSKAEWPLPDSWKDGPLEISVVDATNESAD
ncbi:MAG: hypothetical protein II036_04545, partial [Oscillospiraceae bacterium]|nr:hypothetical protein [Oscillospiraceae bacterium]